MPSIPKTSQEAISSRHNRALGSAGSLSPSTTAEACLGVDLGMPGAWSMATEAHRMASEVNLSFRHERSVRFLCAYWPAGGAVVGAHLCIVYIFCVNFCMFCILYKQESGTTSYTCYVSWYDVTLVGRDGHYRTAGGGWLGMKRELDHKECPTSERFFFCFVFFLNGLLVNLSDCCDIFISRTDRHCLCFHLKMYIMRTSSSVAIYVTVVKETHSFLWDNSEQRPLMAVLSLHANVGTHGWVGYTVWMDLFLYVRGA